MKHGKKYQDSVKSFDKQKLYDPREGLEAVLATAKAKFNNYLPGYIRELLQIDSHTRSAVSKYCICRKFEF